MKRWLATLAAAGCCGMLWADTTVWLDEMDLGPMTSGWGRPRPKLSIEGNPLKPGRKKTDRGVGTHADSFYFIETGGAALSFQAKVGVDFETAGKGKGSVCFRVYADGRLLYDSGVMISREAPKEAKADLTGARLVLLQASDGGDSDSFDHADWGDAFFTVKDGAKLKPVPPPPAEQLGILTPPESPSPRINGPAVFGVRPGHPILFTLPVTGERPVRLSATGIPAGAAFDPSTGRLSGAVAQAGTHVITFTAENARGKASRAFRLAVGDTLALTPPMGWNSWYCFEGTVSDAKMRAAADAMVSSGLANHGWSYVNLDDCWAVHGDRAKVTGLCNERFPDMKALTDYIHGLGLKAGIYTSPGPATCMHCAGSWQHEREDARRYADWGFDLLKYDWCSYSRIDNGKTLKGLMRPYLLMGKALHEQDRDLVYSLCQYGMGNVSTWGALVGGNFWRITGDADGGGTWKSVLSMAAAQDGLEPFVGPGAWNDPDMLMLGKIGLGRLTQTTLTPNEQYAHVSLWCLSAAPLLFGGDMTQLDAFTRNLLTNDEVLEVDQDPLGKAAEVWARDLDGGRVWGKQMEDGSFAVGILNGGPIAREVTFSLKDAGLEGSWRTRDLWRQRDLPAAQGAYTATLPPHAIQLLRLWKNN
jgi:alpha-galactosidase